MVKLVVQVPCFNEEGTLPLVLKDIPRKIDGVDCIETQIIDDGSTDRTVEVAKECGVDYIITYIGHKGLGEAFKRGANAALERDVDILVNTDGDNQYSSKDIPVLIRPILEKRADMVIGNRNPRRIAHFSSIKRFLHREGSFMVQVLSGVPIPDALSGFRAYSKRALLELNVTTSHSYVLDTTMQAVQKKLKILYIDIQPNLPTRSSRLIPSLPVYIKKTISNMFRVYSLYFPLKIFIAIGSLFILLGLIPIMRFLYYYFALPVSGKTQSLIFGMMFEVIGFQFLGLGILGEIMAKQRQLTEDILNRLKGDLCKGREGGKENEEEKKEAERDSG